MAFTGLASQTRNFGPGLQLPPGSGGPVRRLPGQGLTGQFAQQDEQNRLAMQYPGANPGDIASTAGAEMEQRGQTRSDQFNPQPEQQIMHPQGLPSLGFPTPMLPGRYQQGAGLVVQPTPVIMHRAGGGPIRRTRQFAPGTANVPYGYRGQGMVTGGTGASPALPGRIGYRGQLQAAPSEQPGAGLAYLEQGQNQRAFNQGARLSKDAVGGLSQNPTQDEINAQLRMLAMKGDESGLEGKGLGGVNQAQALSEYYQAKRMGDPDAIAAAAQKVEQMKTNLTTLRSGRTRDIASMAGNAANAAAGTVATGFGGNPAANGADGTPPPAPLGATMPPPAGTAPADAGNTPFTGQSTTVQDGQWQPDTGTIPGKKKGGDVADVHPYIVNEKGPEAFQPKGGKPELMPGPEHMTTFPQDGKVIPHGRTMRMMEEGKIAAPKHDFTGQAPVRRTAGIAGPLQRLGILPPRSPLAGLERGATGLIQRGLNTAISPFVEEPIMDSRAHGDVSVPYTPQENPFTEPAWEPEIKLPNEGAPPALPPNPAATQNAPFPTGSPLAIPGQPTPETFVGVPEWMAQAAQQHAAQNAAAANNATQAIMSNRGVQQIAPLQGQDRSFLTPYGTAGVKFKAHGGKVNRTRSIAMSY